VLTSPFLYGPEYTNQLQCHRDVKVFNIIRTFCLTFPRPGKLLSEHQSPSWFQPLLNEEAYLMHGNSKFAIELKYLLLNTTHHEWL
jgi:hypothetical protein